MAHMAIAWMLRHRAMVSIPAMMTCPMMALILEAFREGGIRPMAFVAADSL